VRKISPPPEFDPRTVQPLGNRYTDNTTRPTKFDMRTEYLQEKKILRNLGWEIELSLHNTTTTTTTTSSSRSSSRSSSSSSV
jgi:hypothetical protein